MINLIDSKENRTVSRCVYNQLHNHTHIDRIFDLHDMFYILEGEWEIYEEGISYHLEKDSLIFLHGNHHHYGIKPSSETVKTCYIHFNICQNDKWLEEYDGSLENCFYIPTVVDCKNNPMIKDYFDKIYHLFYSDEKYKEEQLRGLLIILLAEISKQSMGNTPSSKIVRNTLDIIYSATNRFFTIEELAKANYVCPKTLSATFKKETGITVHQFQTNLKMKLAYDLIRKDNLSLKSVAEHLGYCDEYHFSKAYKKFYNRTPIKGNK